MGLGVGVGVGWRRRGSTRSGQPSRMAELWAAVARGGRGNGGVGVGRRAEARRHRDAAAAG
jgi:hypothetical protein